MSQPLNLRLDYTITVSGTLLAEHLATTPSTSTTSAQSPRSTAPSSSLINSIYSFSDNFDSIYTPLFNLYHSCKGNAFLNTKDEQAKYLEAAGNFFLKPVQYLLNGKTITKIEANQITEMRQTNDYTNDGFAIEGLKTALAILSLPITLLIGSALKGLSLISFEIRQKNKMIESEIHSIKVVSNEALYRSKGIPQLFSDEIVNAENFPFPAPTQKQLIQMQTVNDVVRILDEQKIPHWLDCGTLLGARRHKSMIPWDTDVDMGILSNDFTNVMRALRKLDPKKYAVQDWSSALCKEMFIRVVIKETNSYLDIYHHVINTEDQTICYKYSWTDSPWVIETVKKRELFQEKPIKIADVFPLKKARFGTTLANVPGNWEAFLKVKYGPNLAPCKIWNSATGEYDKVVDHPYWQHSDF